MRDDIKSAFTYFLVLRLTYFLQASSRELLAVQRGSVVAVGGIACTIALTVDSILGMFILAADIVFVALLPQLISAVYFEHVNTYGSFLGFLTAVVLRIGAGEQFLNLKPFLFYGSFYDNELGHLFPYRTFAMLSSLIVLLFVSYFTRYLFLYCRIVPYLDIFNCFQNNILLKESCMTVGTFKTKDSSAEEINRTCEM